MAFKFKTRSTKPKLNVPGFPSLSAPAIEEALTGTVNDMPASAAEERLANALREAQIPFMFRMTIGAPRGLPGWKELDFLAMTKGMLYTIEVDSAFTHRGKANADVLHDAIILNDPELQMYGTVFPRVFHVDGESELADKVSASAWVRHRIGKG